MSFLKREEFGIVTNVSEIQCRVSDPLTSFVVKYRLFIVNYQYLGRLKNSKKFTLNDFQQKLNSKINLLMQMQKKLNIIF